MTSAILAEAPSDLYITPELHRRVAKKADYLREKRALQDLASRMLDHPEEVLPRFVDLALQMTGGVSSGLSLFESEPAPGVFRWRYLRGTLEPFENTLTPRDFSPCGVTLDEKRPVLSRHPERVYNWISDAGIVVPEVLLVPLYLGGHEPLGTLWIVAEEEGHLDAEHARIATELASFAGIALRMLKSEQQLQMALNEQETLAQEMSHRVKNLFMIAEGLVRSTAKVTETKDELAETLTGRFQALAGAHGLVRRSFTLENEKQRVADLGELLNAIFKPHEKYGGSAQRFSVSGPAVVCGERAANGLALIFHELTTNAVKYGALRNDDGTVDVRWTETDDNIEFHWSERGGPEIAGAPGKEGFGSKLLRDTITRQFGGKFDHNWSADGLKVRIDVPVRSFAT